MWKSKKEQKPKKQESFQEQVKVFFSTYLLALLIRTFIIEASQIPSQSMVPSLLVGDTLMVQKISLGTYIPVLNIKLPGFAKPDKNDMVVFISPEWKSPGFMDELVTFLSLSIINKDNTFQNPKILVKRIVAGPGDIVSMTNQRLHINQQKLSETPFTNQNQEIYSRGRRQGRMSYNLFLEQEGTYQRVIQHATDSYQSDTNLMLVFDQPNFEQMIRSILFQGFPPIRVPEKGKEIIIEKLNNYEKYLLQMLIQRESGKTVVLQNGQLFQKSQQIISWMPKDDYYFMMGDNRDFSEDSRYFGYVPKQRIYGRLLFRYWPLNRFTFDSNQKK